MTHNRRAGWALLFAVVGLTCLGVQAATVPNQFAWNAAQSRVTADIEGGSLYGTLKQIATATGWRVYLEPGVTRQVSAKFSELPPGDALRLLLGDLNYALVPDTNGSLRLFVFRTSRQNATQLVEPAERSRTGAPAGKVIPNQLIVRLKPGAKIEEWARLLGARVTGRIDSLNAYRLEFDSEAATEAARQQLAASSDVESVDNNYAIDRPPSGQPVSSQNLPPPPRLRLNPPPADGRIIVGLIDTAVQPLGGNLDPFVLEAISVAGPARTDPNSPTHGTSMAGTVLRSLEEVTKGGTAVQILPVDVYGANPSTSTFDVAKGVVMAVNSGAKVINLSLGSPGDDSLLRSVLLDVSKQNIPVFAAAGNEPVTTPVYPAAYPGVTAVTAVDHGRIAPYANRGSFVSLGVPGTSVVYYQNQPYQVVGTSAASASAAGLAAGYMDATRSTPAQMKSFMSKNFGVTRTPAGK